MMSHYRKGKEKEYRIICNMVKEKKYIYKVSELTQNIKIILEHSFPNIWVEGEISNLRVPSSGHSYFTLKDNNSQIKAVLFRQ